MHPVVSGNKWRKLKHLLLKIESQGFKKVAVMGGQYSNLLHSISYLGMTLGWQVELYVRGYQHQTLTPMLKDAKRWSAKIIYCDKISFKGFRDSPPELDKDVFWISEGAYDQMALKGSIESLMEVNQPYDYLIIASATGTSLAGYCQAISSLSLQTKVIGIRVLKNDDEISQRVTQLTDGRTQPEIITGYEFGGYAKQHPDLIAFIKTFEQQHKIPLEAVYNGKSFYAAMDLITKNYFPKGSRILLIHCGGLQGKRK